MDKIIQLLKEIGASDELADAISEELQKYDAEIHEQYKGVYNAKLQKAKQLCAEEVENYKVDLANKVSVFLESKSSQIEKKLEQQRSIEEGNAMSKLRTVREITEDIEVASDAEIKAMKAKLDKTLKENENLLEDKKRAEIAANRANEMALSIIRERKEAEEDGVDGKKMESMPPSVRKKIEQGQDEEDGKGEDEEGEEDGEVMESKRRKKPVVKEDLSKRRKKSAKPSSTRRTLVESQVPSKKSNNSGISGPDRDIMEIANSLDD